VCGEGTRANCPLGLVALTPLLPHIILHQTEEQEQKIKERLRRWVKENGVKVHKNGSVFTFVFPSPSELGEKLEELLKEVFR